VRPAFPVYQRKNRVREFGRELLRRRVPAVAALYAGGALAALGAIDDLSEGLGWPPAVFDTALLLLSFGTLNALIAGWFHGAKDDQRWTRQEAVLHAFVLLTMSGSVVVVHAPSTERETRVDPTRISVTGFVSGAKEAEVSGQITGELARLLLRDGVEGFAETPAWVVTGSVRRVDTELRIGVQLSRMPDGLQVWADRVLVPAESTDHVLRVRVPAIADSILRNIKREHQDE